MARDPRDKAAAARRHHPARRAGPAHQRPAGRHPPGDLRLAVRRGAEAGDRGHPGNRVRAAGRLPRTPPRSASNGPLRAGYAEEILHAPGNPFLATLGIRIDPAPAGSGIAFRLEVGHQAVPLYIYKNIENFAAAHAAVRHRDAAPGPVRLAGHRLHGIADPVRRTASPTARRRPAGRSAARRTSASSPRWWSWRALRQAGTVVCEPVHRFRLDTPADTLNVLLPVLARLHAVPAGVGDQGRLVHPGGRHPGDGGARAAAADTAPHPGRRRHGIVLRPLRAGPRPGPVPAADRRQPAQPRGIPPPRHPPRRPANRRASRRSSHPF